MSTNDSRTAAIVTGAGRGIGRATAERFAMDDDYDIVACVDIDDVAHTVADGLAGGVGYQVDVSDHQAVREAVADIESDANLTAVVNNAGITEYYWIEDLEPKSWDRVIDVNLKGQYNLARWAGPHMFRRGKGRMVNVSSEAGTKGSFSGGVHYSASKAGAIGLTYGLAKQLSPHVTVNCVVPGVVKTSIGERDEGESLVTENGRETLRKLSPLQRFGKPEELASVIHFLCSPGASYMTGSVVKVTGGSHLSPTTEFLMPERSTDSAVE